MFNSNQNTLLNPMGAISSTLANDEDRQSAQSTMLGQLAMLALAAGQRQTAGQRAATIAGAAPVIGGYQRDVLNAAQARLMQSKATQEQEEQQRQATIKERLQDPAFAQSLGMTPEMAATLGVPGAIDVLKARAARDPMDAAYKAAMIKHLENDDPLEKQYKQAQIEALNRKDDPNAVIAARTAQADTMGLSGDMRQLYIANGKLPDDTKLTHEQALSQGYVDRLKQAEKIISDPKIASSAQGISGVWNKIVEGLPFSQVLQTEAYQKLSQAERDWINAKMRQESGMNIKPDEFANAEKQYFPLVGNPKAVLDQKAADRATAIKGVEYGASPAYKRQNVTDQPAAGGKPIDAAGMAKVQEAIRSGISPAKIRQHLIERGYAVPEAF